LSASAKAVNLYWRGRDDFHAINGGNDVMILQTAVFFATILSVGCGRPGAVTSAVAPMGPDTWLVSGRSNISHSESQSQALLEAQKFCGSRQREFIMLRIDRDPPSVAGFVTHVSFRCLVLGDPALVRPTLERDPTIIIQNRDAPAR
jgi:hypothetical protein